MLIHILPALKPHLDVLRINDCYLIPVVHGDANKRSASFGFDLCHADNLYVPIDEDSGWIRRRFNNVQAADYDAVTAGSLIDVSGAGGLTTTAR